jgi:GNAT superfamily N-acetyltransferase
VVTKGLELLDSLPDEATSSMHEDLLAGRRLEVEWLSGAVVRHGRERGVATPIHRAAYELLLPQAGGAVRDHGSTPRPLPAGYRLSLQHADLQVDAIHAYLTQSYWSPGILRERVAEAARNSLVASVFSPDGAQVGYARLISDRATFGYLADVYVLDAHRGRGLATAMVQALTELPEARGLRRLMLVTRDAHAVYARLGWTPLSDPASVMQRRGADFRPDAPL